MKNKFINIQGQTEDYSTQELIQDLGTIKIALSSSQFSLSQIMDQHSYCLTMLKLDTILSNFQNLIVLSVDGQTEYFDIVKQESDRLLKEFFDHHQALVLERKTKRKEH